MRRKSAYSVFVSIPTEEHAERIKLEGLLSYAHEKRGSKWHLQIDDGGLLRHITSNFSSFHYDGVIAYVTSNVQRRELSKLSCPTVLIEDLQDPAEPIVRPNVATILCDHYEEGKRAALHLLSLHFRDFAWIGPTQKCLWADRRRQGFADTIRAHGHTCRCYPMPHGEASRNFSVELPAMAKWLRRLPRPCALFVCRDIRARQVITAANITGITIPDCLAVLGVDNDEIICTTTTPSLSSVSTSDRIIGYTAGRTLDRLLLGQAHGKVLRSNHPTVITRMSTDADAIRDPYVARALQFVRNHLSDKFDAQTLASHVKLPRQALQIRSGKVLGVTLGREIQRIRLAAAATALLNTDSSVDMIAHECGFASTSYLSLKMKQAYGKTPLAYRNAHKIF